MFRVKESRSAKQAFTLIELIIVIAVIGILVLLAAPKFLGYTKDAKLAQITNDVKAHESAIETERAKNDSFIDDWELVDNSDLEGYANSGSLFDKKGPIDNDSFEGFSGEHYSVPEGLVNSKLKGDFYLAEGGNVYYNKGEPSEPSEPESQLKTQSFNFDEAVGAEQTHTVELDDLNELKSITSDNGDVEVVSTDGNKVTVKVNNGELVRKKQTGGELLEEDTKYVEFETVGVEEGKRIVNNVKNKGGIKHFDENNPVQVSSNDDIDLVTGPDGYFASVENPLNREYIGAAFRMITQKLKLGETLESYVFENGEWGPPRGNHAIGMNSGQRYKDQNTEDGYFTVSMGNYTLGDLATEGRYISNIDGDIIDERELLLVIEEGTYAEVFKHETSYEWDTMAVKGGFENARWKYSGEVTKPAEDTRTYDEYYKYSITVEYK